MKILDATKRTGRLAAHVLVLAALGHGVPAFAAGYTATILPGLGGTSVLAKNIDDSGTISGSATTAGNAETHAMLWKAGQIIDIGATNSGIRTAHQSNPAGQAIVSGSPSGSFASFLYSNGALTALPGYTCCGAALNSSGAVAYSASDGQAMLFQYGQAIGLGSFGGDSATPRAINDAGHVTGYVYTSGADLRAFVWKEGVETIIEPLAGSAPGNSTIALDVNDAGDVLVMTSVSSNPNAWHVGIWRDSAIIDTGISTQESRIPADGYAINNSGHVLTEYGVWIDGTFTGIEDMMPAELAPGEHDGFYWLFHTLTGMNDAGQITGRVMRYNTTTWEMNLVSFVLTPGSICTF